MNKIIYVFSVIILIGCSSNSKTDIPSVDSLLVTSEDITMPDLNKVDLMDVDSYFSKKRVDEPAAYVLSEDSSFEEHFGAAKTVSNMPTVVDFSIQRVGAIVLPESSYNTEISLGDAYISGKTLNVPFSIREEPGARSYSIVPVKLFTFDKGQSVDSVVFVNGVDKILVPVK